MLAWLAIPPLWVQMSPRKQGCHHPSCRPISPSETGAPSYFLISQTSDSDGGKGVSVSKPAEHICQTAPNNTTKQENTQPLHGGGGCSGGFKRKTRERPKSRSNSGTMTSFARSLERRKRSLPPPIVTRSADTGQKKKKKNRATWHRVSGWGTFPW